MQLKLRIKQGDNSGREKREKGESQGEEKGNIGIDQKDSWKFIMQTFCKCHDNC